MPPNSFGEIKNMLEEMGNTWHEYRKTNDERIKALEDGDLSRAKELDTKLVKMEKDLSIAADIKKKYEVEQKLVMDRLEELETRASSPGKTMAMQRKDEYKDIFLRWVRSQGKSTEDEVKMQHLHREMSIRGDVTIATGAPGGFAVPEEISREIERLELLFSPVRRIVKVVQTGTSDYKELVNIRGTTSGWVGESGTRTATATSQLREVAPTHGELYAYPQASEWSLDDIFFNVEAWIADEVAQAFALAEGTAVISGDGTSKPSGLLKGTPVSTEDFASPLRGPTALQFVESQAGSPGDTTILNADAIITLVYKLRSEYRSGATFTMNSMTMGAVRKIKDSTGQYLWQPSLQAGQPDRLLGFGLEAWEQMDDIGANKFPIFFGNFRRGYVLTDRVGLRITRDNVTNVGFVRFYVRRREGGIVLNNDSIKLLKVVA